MQQEDYSSSNCQMMLKDYQGALEDLNKADVLEPNDAFTLRSRGDVKGMLKDYKGALEDLNKANVLQPNDAFTLRKRGDVKRMLKDYQGALEDLNKADVLEPNDAFTLRKRGDVKRLLKDYQGALEDLDKAHVLEPNDAFTLRSRGDVKRILKDYQGALEDLDKANVLELNNAFTLPNRGNVKRRLKDYQGALEDLDKAHVLEPNNAFTLQSRGGVKRMLKDYQGALEDLHKANVLEPNDAFTLRNRGDAKRMLKDDRGALEDLDKADVLEPNNAFTLKIRGEVKRMLKDYQGALEDLDKADVLEPNNAFTLKSRGEVKRMLKDYQGALKDLDKANVFEPNNVFTLISHAYTHWSLNNYQIALGNMEKVHVFEPNNHLILQTQNWLKWMLTDYQPMIESLHCNSSIRVFAYDELNFCKSLGKGAFGKVYECRSEGIKIAVKVLKWNGSHNEGAKKSFTSEVRTLGLTQHINLVRLLGYCIEGLRHMLVYEYMSNKSLDQRLSHDKHLNWNKRTSIIIGVAQGLAYLHHKCNPSIVHIDIKLGNILLDKDYTPKLADFGLAKILNVTNESLIQIENIALASTSTPGSFGYTAPEIRQESKQRHVSPKCDVYSFGVLLIELVKGSRFTLDKIEFRNFIQRAQKIHVEKDGFQQLFNVIRKNSIVGFNNNEAKLILQISLECIQEDPKKRPGMQDILQMLEGLDGKKDIQFTKSIQDYFDMLLKRF
ncbi:hypothetical protein BDL97_05G115300 [Sphagnum fallax]|nr:hypothetical protein BDL97_05G115300 [Sphagnum fallax]